MNKKEESDIKFSEKFSLKVRKTIIVSKLFTILVVILLISAFIGLNVWVQSLDLPELDVTANKVYTLSDASKNAIKDINQDIKIYVFGIDESNSVVGLIKQYCNENPKITYEMLSSDTNLAKVKEFELEDGYQIIVIESQGSRKLIDASSEFHSYDYTTYAEVDITEQTLTNSMLAMVTDNKPKVYFVEGHEEYKLENELGVLSTYLKNEAIDATTINLSSITSIPEDCDVLAICAPSADYLENEAQIVIDYINRGGNLFITKDILGQQIQLTNFQKILDCYGITIPSGYIVETDNNTVLSNYPYIFRPEISSSNSITSDIASDSFMWLAYAQKIDFLPEEQLQNLNVTYETLLSTSDSALYVTSFDKDVNEATKTAQSGKFTIAAQVTKKLGDSNETEENSKESKLIIVGNGSFSSDYVVTQLSQSYPISYLGSNKDFAINSLAILGNKDVGLTIRKDMAGTSYVFSASTKQNIIVLTIIFVIPVVILIIGIIVGRLRKRRK